MLSRASAESVRFSMPRYSKLPGILLILIGQYVILYTVKYQIKNRDFGEPVYRQLESEAFLPRQKRCDFCEIIILIGSVFKLDKIGCGP